MAAYASSCRMKPLLGQAHGRAALSMRRACASCSLSPTNNMEHDGVKKERRSLLCRSCTSEQGKPRLCSVFEGLNTACARKKKEKKVATTRLKGLTRNQVRHDQRAGAALPGIAVHEHATLPSALHPAQRNIVNQ